MLGPDGARGGAATKKGRKLSRSVLGKSLEVRERPEGRRVEGKVPQCPAAALIGGPAVQRRSGRAGAGGRRGSRHQRRGAAEQEVRDEGRGNLYLRPRGLL